jgi:response regulator RpfG family c-di-GMP phosphodiesterase
MYNLKPRILYIDDEKINLVNFTQTFGRDFQIFTAGNGEEALALLAREGEMAAVISDQRMPGLTGVDLLFKVRELHPESVRIVITAYTEVPDLIDAINRGHIYKYIVKPWDNDELGVTLKNAVALYGLTRKNRELTEELIRANGSLEKRVEQRTVELEEANRMLSCTNEQLTTTQQLIQTQSREVEQLNGELNTKVVELEEALSKVKILQGLLPICSYCKKIRDDRNYWLELETFMSNHGDILFTHSICPGCYDTYVQADLKAFRKSKEAGNGALGSSRK